MAPTLASVRRDLRVALGERTARRWQDNDLDRYINLGCSDIAKLEVLQATATIAIAANAGEATMPANCIRVHRADFKATGSDHSVNLEYRDFHNNQAVQWTTNSTGMPAMFALWGTPGAVKLKLYPMAGFAGNLYVHYYRLPTYVDPEDDDEVVYEASLDSTVLDIPAGWEQCVISHAEYLALRADRDPRWQEAHQLYTELLGAMHDLTRRHTDQSGEIVGSDGEGFWLYAMGDEY